MAESGSRKTYPVKFVWDHGGSEVFVCITNAHSKAGRTIAMAKTANGHHEVIVKLSQGRFEYR